MKIEMFYRVCYNSLKSVRKYRFREFAGPLVIERGFEGTGREKGCQV